MRPFPLLWGTLYIVSIPFFAWVYWTLPADSFFHSSLGQEQQYITKKAELSGEIEKIISLREPHEYYESYFNSFEGYKLGGVGISNVEPDSEGNTFEVSLKYNKLENIVDENGWVRGDYPGRHI